jgi:WXG100 family type VII secretion target
MPISASFRTEVGTTQVAARHVDEVANAIDGELRALDNRIQPITSTWSGPAASAFMALHERWLQDATKLRQVLGEISQGLVQNANLYQANEDQAAAAATNVMRQL